MKAYAMRRKDRATDEAAALAILQDALFATVSCRTPDGEPYGVVVSHAVEGKTLYFHCAMNGLKVECFANDSRVCVSAVAYAATNAPKQTTDFRSAVAFGTIRPCGDEEAKAGLRVIGRKFTPANMGDVEKCIADSLDHTRVYAVDIGQITGKANIQK